MTAPEVVTPKTAAPEITTVVELSERLSALGAAARRLRDSKDLDLHYQRQVSPNYETELIQIAASAIAALTDLRLKRGWSRSTVDAEIEREIQQERIQQDARFGMPQNLDPLVWITILLEELAEASDEIWG